MLSEVKKELKKECKGTNYLYGVYKIIYDEYMVYIIHYISNKILAKITNYFICIYSDLKKDSLLYKYLSKLSKKFNLKMTFINYTQKYVENSYEGYNEKLIKEVI